MYVKCVCVVVVVAAAAVRQSCTVTESERQPLTSCYWALKGLVGSSVGFFQANGSRLLGHSMGKDIKWIVDLAACLVVVFSIDVLVCDLIGYSCLMYPMYEL